MRCATLCLFLLLAFSAVIVPLRPALVFAAERMRFQGEVVLLDDDSYALRTDMGYLPLRGDDFLLYAGQHVDAVGTLTTDVERGDVLDVLSLTPTGSLSAPLQANPYN